MKKLILSTAILLSHVALAGQSSGGGFGGSIVEPGTEKIGILITPADLEVFKEAIELDESVYSYDLETNVKPVEIEENKVKAITTENEKVTFVAE